MKRSCQNCWYHHHLLDAAFCSQSERARRYCKDWKAKDGDGLSLHKNYGYPTMYVFQTQIGKEAYTIAHSAREAYQKLRGYGVKVCGKDKYRVATAYSNKIRTDCLQDGWCYG